MVIFVWLNDPSGVLTASSFYMKHASCVIHPVITRRAGFVDMASEGRNFRILVAVLIASLVGFASITE
ncbi:hypothetical protein AB6A40_009672 [Gnathostoma spinigerum]|uniref:Uncharacterized protein n=1 Tax=Gnathostoma spinigerum TaxID=75299 RepID=A0ABD6F0C6_9BILA